MKKLLFIFTLLFAFSFSASAQDKKVATVSAKIIPAEAAKANANELAAYVGLDATQTEDFFRLFEMKYQTLAVENLSAERKQILAQTMEGKIRASLNEKQITKLEGNKELFNKLIQ